MKIIEPSATLVDDINATDIYTKIECCGRVCYQSTPKGKPEEFIRMLIKRGHESVLEHVSLTFHIICDRAVMSELTRHRLASFIMPPLDEWGLAYRNCHSAAVDAEDRYKSVINSGHPPELARAVLPLCLKSELYMTANLREWRHILKLRTSKAAHPQMRIVAGQILQIFRDKLPVIVEDIQP